MSDFKNNKKAKRYFWLKLKPDFFDQKEIKLLRKIAGGDTFTIIYLKMLLVSLKDNGRLYFEAIGENFEEEVALLIDEDTENVALTISFLRNKGLLEIEESDEYFLNRVPEMVGSESYSTERVRRHRKKTKEQEDGNLLQSNGQALQSNNHVTKSRDRVEIEKSRDRVEIEKTLKNITDYYEQNGFGSISSKTIEDFGYWIKDFKKIGTTETDAIEIIIYSLGIAIDNNVRKYSYANSILRDWEQHKYLTVAQIKKEDIRKSKSKGSVPDSELPETGEDW